MCDHCSEPSFTDHSLNQSLCAYVCVCGNAVLSRISALIVGLCHRVRSLGEREIEPKSEYTIAQIEGGS